MKVNQYEIYCNTDSKHEHWWIKDGDPVPTTCPVNTAHSVNLESAIIVDHLEVSETKTITSLRHDDISTRDFGDVWTATKETTTTRDTPLISKYIKGGSLEVINVKIGDTITIQICDVDNVLGYGAEFVVNEFLKDVPIKSDGFLQIKSHAISKAIPNGLKLRQKYTSVSGATIDPKVCLTVYGYNDV